MESGHVFTSAKGTPLNGENTLHRFQDRLQRAGLPRMRVHDLRHGTASVLKTMGYDIRVIMEVLGHSQISLIANTYTHIAPQVLRDAAEGMQRALYGQGERKETGT